MSFLSSVRGILDAKNRGTNALSPIPINAAKESVELKTFKKQRYYISKLQQLSNKLALSKEAAPHELPPPPNPQRVDEAVDKEVNENDNEEVRMNELHENRQIRCRNKLKELGKMLRESEASINSNNSSFDDPSCVTLDIIRERTPSDIVKPTDRTNFQLPKLFGCCNSIETYVGDVFSTDDDIEQLLLREALDDTNISDEWSFDDTLTPSEQTKQGSDTSIATDSCTWDEGSLRDRSLQRENFARDRSLQRENFPRDRAFQREKFPRDGSSRDDDTEQLLLREALDDTNLTDESTFDVTLTPSEQTKQGADTSIATDTRDEGSLRDRSLQRENFPRDRSLQREKFPRGRSSSDDDTEQLLLREALDDTNLTDEWSFDVTLTPSEQTKQGTDTSIAMSSCTWDEGSLRDRSLQREKFPRDRSSQREKFPRDRSSKREKFPRDRSFQREKFPRDRPLQGEGLLRHGTFQREGSSKTALLFRGDPCEM